MRTATLCAIGLLTANAVFACDCYGPQTFCQTQAPPPPEWEYTPPDHIILGVKLGEVSYGMDVKVLVSFSGGIVVDDTVRVWGDCGLLCRWFVNTWADGDTLVLGLHDVDFQGNWLCGTSLEQPGDLMISICGTQWLDYENGMVVGQITAEVEQMMSLDQFAGLIGGCPSLGVEEASGAASFVVLYDGLGPVIQWPGLAGVAFMQLIDARGAIVLERTWRGELMRVEGVAAGGYVVVARANGVLVRRKLSVPR